MKNHDPVGTQYASVNDHGREYEIWRSLARKTELSIERLLEIRALDPSLGCLFGPDHKLKSSTELRSLDRRGTLGAKPSLEQRQLELMKAKYPHHRISGREAQLELMRQKALWFNEYS
jgi:hypothetical protein